MAEKTGTLLMSGSHDNRIGSAVRTRWGERTQSTRRGLEMLIDLAAMGTILEYTRGTIVAFSNVHLGVPHGQPSVMCDIVRKTHRLRHWVHGLHQENGLEHSWIAAQPIEQSRGIELATIAKIPETIELLIQVDKPIVNKERYTHIVG